MSLAKIRISVIEKIEDTEGKFGPQKKITLKDENHRRISGWVPAKTYNEADWQTGKTHELEVWQNGHYWNFKLVGKKEKENEIVMETIRQCNKEVMEALRKLWTKVDVLEKKIHKGDAWEPPHTSSNSFEDDVPFPG